MAIVCELNHKLFSEILTRLVGLRARGLSIPADLTLRQKIIYERCPRP